MTADACPEFEELCNALAEGHGPALDHAKGCVFCSAMLEEHRQLEKDLYRLSDPLPPPNFVHSVMAKVAAAPVPVRTELKTGLSIVAVTLAAAVVAFFSSQGNVAAFSSGAASTIVGLQAFAVGAENVLGLIWRTAAVPTAVALTLLTLFSLLVLKRLAGGSQLSDAEVSS